MVTHFKTVRTLILKSLFMLVLVSVAKAESFTIEETLPVPFGPFASVLNTASKEGLKTLVRLKDCDKVGTKADDRDKDKQYRCGEIPVGKIVDDQWKLLDQMNLGKEFSEDKGKNTYKFKNAKGGEINLDLFLFRRQTADEIKMNTLREFGSDKVDVSRVFGRDLFVQINPVQGALQQKACLLAPGIKARASNVKLKGKIRRKDAFCFIWCADAKAEGTVDIDFGDIEMGSAKACADIQTTIVEGKPVVTLTDDGEIQFNDIKHTGLKVKAHMKAKDWISKVLEFFGVEISEMISKAVAKAVKKETGKLVDINVKKIKSGEYFKDYLDKAKLAPLVKKLNKEIQKSYQELEPETKISNLVRDVMCVEPISKLDISLNERRELLNLCRVTTELNFKKFTNDSDSRALGCYKYMFKTNQSLKDTAKQLAWREECSFGVSLSLKIEMEMSELQQCLVDAWKTKELPSDICKDLFATFVESYGKGDLDALLERVNKKTLPDLSDIDIHILRRLSLEHLGDETLTFAELKALLNN